MIDPNRIFSVRDDEEFDRLALEVFRFQAEACAPYREYLGLLGIGPQSVGRVSEIPFLPIGVFKNRRVYAADREPETVFTSSSTTGQTPAKHYVADLELYRQAFTRAFERFYGPVGEVAVFALLPSYLEREGSSLIYMADRLIRDGAGGGFYLYDHEALLRDMRACTARKVLLGVSYALWDLAERRPGPLYDTVVMETGGMKGYREEIPKEEFHKILCDAFGVREIHSEYGMAELTSQAYSQGGNRFRCPAWMRVTARDVNDPFERLPAGTRGGLNIADLANRWSCAFIQTQDVGRVEADGSFLVEGRIDHSDIRGCNLLVQ